MEDILDLLTGSEIIHDYEILSILQDEDFYYLKIKSYLADSSILYIKIYLSDTEYNYSFHWQKESGEFITRWDNAPHHKEIKTYPHHMHTPGNTRDSFSITLADVLKKIETQLSKR